MASEAARQPLRHVPPSGAQLAQWSAVRRAQAAEQVLVAASSGSEMTGSVAGVTGGGGGVVAVPEQAPTAASTYRRCFMRAKLARADHAPLSYQNASFVLLVLLALLI